MYGEHGYRTNTGPNEHGSLSCFGTVLTDAKKLTKRSMGGEVVDGNLESTLDCEPYCGILNLHIIRYDRSNHILVLLF